METKQTAVEYLFETYCDLLAQYNEGKVGGYKLGIKLSDAKHKALAMEQAQIAEAISNILFPQNESNED